MSEFAYYDLRARRGGHDISTLFPNWLPGDERVLVLSPHDDDALLGAGYAMAACRAHGAQVHVAICCDGSAGYSRVEDKETIVATRHAETLRAYGQVGLAPENVHALDFPDFSLVSYIGWRLSAGREGTLRVMMTLLRRLGITRLMIPNGYREHSDHEAAYDIGRYDGVQVGDPVGVDWGTPTTVRSTIQYAVWGNLSPEDALVSGDDAALRANRAIVVPYAVEEGIGRALAEWRSQGQIIQGLLAARRERDCGQGLVEVYVAMDPRPKLDYRPYTELIPNLPLE